MMISCQTPSRNMRVESITISLVIAPKSSSDMGLFYHSNATATNLEPRRKGEALCGRMTGEGGAEDSGLSFA